MRIGRTIRALALAGVVAGTGLGAAPLDEARGPVTNLPMPRFVSLKADEGNVRRGPSLGHRIDWVYRLKNLPLQIVAEHGHWRRVEDRDGLGGWVHYSLLSGVRTAIVEADSTSLRMKPAGTSPENARAERGVVVRVDKCSLDWCQVRADGHRGWVEKATLWGVGGDEILE